MKALLIIAHGSRKKEYNEEIRELAADMAKSEFNRFDFVKCAFNQFAEPTFHEQLNELIESGATHIKVLPYFIAAGGHVSQDIPELINDAKANHPNIVIETTPHLGKFRGIIKMILDEVS